MVAKIVVLTLIALCAIFSFVSCFLGGNETGRAAGCFMVFAVLFFALCVRFGAEIQVKSSDEAPTCPYCRQVIEEVLNDAQE